MDTQIIIDQWLKTAEKDWQACQHLYEAKDYCQCLFWGHLVLEKILKALVVKNTHAQAPYSHDLVLLAKRAQVTLTEEQRDFLNEISTFNQFGRYDDEIMTFIEKCDADYTKKYFLITKNLYQWLKEFFPNKP